MNIKVDDIEINIVRKKIKNINIRLIPPYGDVKVSAPTWLTDKQIIGFIREKVSWIRKHKEQFKNLNIIEINKAVEGARQNFLGNTYLLKINYIDKYPRYIELLENNIILNIKEETSYKKREEFLKEWYREQLKENILPLIKKWEDILNVDVADFGVKQMKTRWGTCNIATKKIWINLELVKLPPKYLEYVIVHELVHLLEKNHTNKFWAYMDKFLPKWEQLKQELNEYIILTK